VPAAFGAYRSLGADLDLAQVDEFDAAAPAAQANYVNAVRLQCMRIPLSLQPRS